MLERVGNFIRMLIRPAVTLGLCAAIVERVHAGDVAGAKELGVFFGVAMTFWFTDRSQQNHAVELGAK